MIFRLFLTLFPCFCMAVTPWPFPPATLSTPNVNASDPSAAIASNGSGVAVWIENGFVVSSTQLFKQNWSFPVTTVSGSGASQPQVVVDLNGKATAIWLENGIVTTSTLPINGNWSLPVALSGPLAVEAQMAIDPSGNIVVVWQEGGVIQSSTQLIGGSWPIIPDVLSGPNASLPAVSIGIQGTVSVVWQQSDNSIHVISKSISGSWGAFQSISTAGINSSHPQVTVNAEGDTIAVWFRFDLLNGAYSNVMVQSAYQPANGVWTTPINIPDTPGVLSPDRLQLSVNSSVSNEAIVWWTNSYERSLFNLNWNIWNGANWTESLTLIGDNLTTYAFDDSMSIRDNSYVVTMYFNSITSQVEVWGRSFSLEALTGIYAPIWSVSVAGNSGYPSVSSNQVGSTPYAIGVWENFNGSYQSVQALSSKFPVILPPATFSAVQQSTNYGVFVQYNNVLSWSPSPSSNVIGYVVARNGVLLANLTGAFFGYTYTDVNQVQNETVNYSIYAFDINGFISNVATATVN